MLINPVPSDVQEMKIMKQIIVVKPKSLSKEDIHKLQENGMIVIEHERPDEVKIKIGIPEIEGGIIMNAAIKAIAESSFSDASVKFVQNLNRSLQL